MCRIVMLVGLLEISVEIIINLKNMKKIKNVVRIFKCRTSHHDRYIIEDCIAEILCAAAKSKETFNQFRRHRSLKSDEFLTMEIVP